MGNVIAGFRSSALGTTVLGQAIHFAHRAFVCAGRLSRSVDELCGPDGFPFKRHAQRREKIMRFALVTALFALLLIAGTSLPAAAAGASDNMRERDTRDRAAARSDDGLQSGRRRTARATTSDTDEDYEARPRQRYEADDGDRPRYTKRRHAHAAKRSGRSRPSARSSAPGSRATDCWSVPPRAATRSLRSPHLR